MNRPLFVFDFDGVICDSTEECIVTAWNAWLRLKGKPRFLMHPQEVPELYQAGIRRLRSYVRTAGEYGVLLQALHEDRAIGSQADYEAAVNAYRLNIKPFAEIFFTARNEMRKRNEKHWLDLHTVYSGIPESLRELWPDFQIFVVTGKDRDAVQLFFRSFNLPLADDRVYDKDAGHDKLGVIRHLAKQLNQTPGSSAFIDDNISHLLPVHQAGFKAFMAEWGYHTEEDLDLARSHQVPILKLDTWAQTIQTAFNSDERFHHE